MAVLADVSKCAKGMARVDPAAVRHQSSARECGTSRSLIYRYNWNRRNETFEELRESKFNKQRKATPVNCYCYYKTILLSYSTHAYHTYLVNFVSKNDKGELRRRIAQGCHTSSNLIEKFIPPMIQVVETVRICRIVD